MGLPVKGDIVVILFPFSELSSVESPSISNCTEILCRSDSMSNPASG